MKAKNYEVIEKYESPYPNSIIFEKDEMVKIVKDSGDHPEWKNWIWCEGSNNNKAWTPRQYVDIQGKKGFLKEHFDAKELSVEVGDILSVHKAINSFGFCTNSKGITGWVPLKNLKQLNY